MPATLSATVFTACHSPAAARWWRAALAVLALAAGGAAVYRYAVPRAAPQPTVRQASLRAVIGRAEQRCLEGAGMFHDVRWAAACMQLAEQNEARHAACVDDPAVTADPQKGPAYCDRQFPLSDGSAECQLPDERAGKLDALLRDAEQKCAMESRAARTP
jgi:hypothetical protein